MSKSRNLLIDNFFRISVILILFIYFTTGIFSQQMVKTLKIPGKNVSFELVFIPPGEFLMGSAAEKSDDEEDEFEDDEFEDDEFEDEQEEVYPEDIDAEVDEIPQRKIKINRGFYMLRHEVTQSQWKAVMGASQNISYFLAESRPVELVSWYECIRFLNTLSEKLGYDKAYDLKTGKCISFTRGLRLPTEAEWEYSCKAGGKSVYMEFRSDDIDAFEQKLKDYAVFGQTLNCETKAVAERKKNRWGLYDMHGNVFEWCNDWYAPYDSESLINPTGPDTGSKKVIRGGGIGSPYYDIRAVNRGNGDSEGEFNDTGFRFVLPAEEKKKQ